MVTYVPRRLLVSVSRSCFQGEHWQPCSLSMSACEPYLENHTSELACFYPIRYQMNNKAAVIRQPVSTCRDLTLNIIYSIFQWKIRCLFWMNNILTCEAFYVPTICCADKYFSFQSTNYFLQEWVKAVRFCQDSFCELLSNTWKHQSQCLESIGIAHGYWHADRAMWIQCGAVSYCLSASFPVGHATKIVYFWLLCVFCKLIWKYETATCWCFFYLL